MPGTDRARDAASGEHSVRPNEPSDFPLKGIRMDVAGGIPWKDRIEKMK